MKDKIVSTSQASDDDSPTFDDDGYTALRPAFDEQNALDALENPSTSDQYAKLPPQEAYDLMKYQAPLSPEELQILRETPFLGPELTFVDDADHEQWLRQQANNKTKAMDKILEDQMYGQGPEEPGVSKQGDDLGWGLSSITHLAKKAAGGIARGARGVARGATHALASVTKAFVPSRDAQKAKLVRDTYARLTQGRANFLQMAAIKAGRKNVPRATYEAQAKVWAKGRLQAGGLPTSTVVGEVATQILGDDVMGSWWNPFSWFQSQVKYVVQNAQGQIAEMSPADFQAWQQQQGVTDPNAAPYQDPNAAPYQDPNAAPYQDPNAAPYQDPNAAYPTDDQQGEEEVMRNYDLVFGDDENNVDLVFGDKEKDYDLVVGNEHAFSGWANDAIENGKHRAKRLISADDYQKLTIARARSSSNGETPSTQDLVTAHRELAAELPRRGVKVARPADASGAWLYKLDPHYWLASSREKALIDAEKKNWEKTEELKKRTGKQKSELTAGRRALYQAEQARAAEAESQAVDTELKDIEESVTSGVTGDSIVGEAAAEGQVLAKKNAQKAGTLADKIEAGEKLSPEELVNLRNCLKMCKHLRKLHDALHERTTNTPVANTPMTSASGYHDEAGEDLVGDPVTEILGRTKRRTSVMGAAPITPNQWVAMTALAVGQPSQLPVFLKTKNLRLSAADLVRLRKATAAAKMIMKHPQYSRATVKGENGLSGDASDVGFSFLSAFKKIATAPLALAAIPAAGIAWGMKKIVDAPGALLNYGAKWGGWGKPGASGPAPVPGAVPFAPNPQDVAAQQARINAANQRRQAALARQQAATAQSAQAQQEYAAQAAAADAEAAAADAEAQAQQDASDAQMAQYGVTPPDDGTTDQSGSVTVIGAEFFTGAFVGEVTDEKAKAIIVEAQKNTPTGKKIRAGATLYHKAKKGDPKARLAIAKMEAKAKKGDKQAQHDVNAVKAGKIALAEKGRAQTKIATKAKREARGQTIHGAQTKLEINVANRLARGTRKRKLAKIAKVERMAAVGHPKAKAAIAKTVAKAHAGDPKAKTTVEALRLAKHVRLHAKTPADAKRLKQAGTLVAKANRGNKKAIRQLALIQAASKQGQPNAKRAMKHIVVAAHVEKTLATGKVHAPSSAAAASAKNAASNKKKYAFIKGRVSSGIATKEEALAGAKLASAMAKTAATPSEEAQLKKEAAALALRARSLRPAAQPIKDAAAVRAAAKGGNKEAQQILSDTLAAAQRGDPKGISGAGKLAAVEAIDAVNKGKPMSPQIAEAVGIVERAHAGDPEAKRTVARAGEAAQSGDPHGVESAVALTAASVTVAALAANAGASKHFSNKAREVRGHKVDTAEQGKIEAELSELMAKLHEGTATRREGVRARELAMALGKTSLAAQISAIMPPDDNVDTPLSSLPDHELPTITGWRSFIREGIKALLLATDDPLANYRAGVQSRGATPMLPAISENKPKT